MPFNQIGNHIAAVDAAKGPHLNDDNFAFQVCEPEWIFGVNPNRIGQLGRNTQVWQINRG